MTFKTDVKQKAQCYKHRALLNIGILLVWDAVT